MWPRPHDDGVDTGPTQLAHEPVCSSGRRDAHPHLHIPLEQARKQREQMTLGSPDPPGLLDVRNAHGS
jgi:hypothetical protein